MVIKVAKLNYELNQILAFEFRSKSVAVGDNIGIEDIEISIFDPELALIGKIDKLPILRGLRIDFQHIPDLGANIGADTGNSMLKGLVQLFNQKSYPNPENPGIFSWNGKHPNLLGMSSMYYEAGVILEHDEFTMKYAGGIPLKPTICFRNELGFSNNVAGTGWSIGGAFHGKIYMEIDWKSISEADFEDYLREYIYVQD